MQTEQAAYAEQFRALHIKGDPIIIYNIWDVGTAKAVAEAGAPAIATGSSPVGAARGFADGENMPLALLIDNVERIVEAVDLPVSVDIEGAYGVKTEVVARTFGRMIQAGAIGFNFEDQIIGGVGVHPIDVQVARIQAARAACDASGVNAFINARTDIFLKARSHVIDPTQGLLDQAIERSKAYAQAGADCFFAAGLIDLAMIEKLCHASPLPVNILMFPGAPDHKSLADAGVARISYGPFAYRKMIEWFTEQAKEALFWR